VSAAFSAAARAAWHVVGPDGLLGITAASLVGSGVGTLYGWPWAAISVGVPLGAFYLYAEARKLAAGVKSEG
jgi:hypothetical protein